MKKYLVALLLLSVGGFSACIPVKKVRYVTVVKDCTGVYLKYQQKDYRVCNKEMLHAYDNGTTIQAEYSRIGSCSSLDTGAVCAMFHASEGMVQVYWIK